MEASEEKNLVPPQSDARDVVYTSVKAALSMVPYAGGAVAELIQFVIQPPLEKRRDQWMNDVADAINILREKQGVEPEDLQNNGAFIDTVIQATHMAYRNSHDEKRLALKNAIVNSGLPHPLDQSLQEMFLNWLDIFTIWHIRLLHLYQDPEGWEKENNLKFERLYAGGASHVLESAYPELKKRRDFYDQVWKDLHQKGLVINDSLHGFMSERGIFEKRTTDLGDKFLGFISN